MPLIKYAQYLTYPDGSPAANTAVPVMLLGGNVLVPLFANKAGTVTLSNPAPTDSDGRATFYAAPGSFATSLAGTLFHYEVDGDETDPAWPGLFVHSQGSAASTWTVNHHIGVEPTVTVLVGGQVVEADVTHPTTEQTVISFGALTTGVALLRR